MSKSKVMIYGLHTVMGFLSASPTQIKCIYLQSDRQDERIKKMSHLAAISDIPLELMSHHRLDQLAEGGVHQGVIAALKPVIDHTEKDLSQLLENLTEPPFLLVLDGIQDPHNLGACLRSANAAGVHAVIIPKDKSAELTPVAYKTASGAAGITPLIKVTNLTRTLLQLKARGIWIYGTSDGVKATLYTADLTGAIAWVMGAEGKGLRRLTQETCDGIFSIPLYGNVTSLNVSVATGICLFEAKRQRIVKSC